MTAKTYTLYSSEGCHLCEQAFELCQQLGVAEQVNVIDIVEHDEYFDTYKFHIPVLENNATAEKLFWPFDLEGLKELL